MKLNSNKIKIAFAKPKAYAEQRKNLAKSLLTGILYIPENLARALSLPTTSVVSAKGYAKCLEGDEFNPETGIKIAVARAESKIYVKTVAAIIKAWKEQNPIGFIPFSDGKKGTEPTLNPQINDFCNRALGCVAHNEKYINELGKIS